MSAPPPEPAQSRWDVVALAVMGGVMVGLTAGKVPPPWPKSAPISAWTG